MNAQIERSIQSEIVIRLRSWPVLVIPVPNGMWIPTRNDSEKELVDRLISRMKTDGMMLPGAFDLCLHWEGGGAIVDCKRPESVDLFGKKRPAGKPSEEQLYVADRAAQIGVNYAFVEGWKELHAKLLEWGVPRERRRPLAAIVRDMPNDTLDTMVDEEAAR